MLLATSNHQGFPLLSLVIFLPLLGAGAIALLGRRNRALGHAMGILVSGCDLVLAGALLALFDRDWAGREAGAAFQFADPARGPAAWLPGGITYHVAVDGIGVVLVFLTSLLVFAALLFGWGSVRERVREYVALLLVLETGLLGVFASLDLFLFFVFWEAVLIPMYLLIGVWGGKDRVYATVKFVLFTMAGSALMLVAIIALVTLSGSPTFHYFDILAQPYLGARLQLLLFGAFALAFAVKVPLFPLHTWLPDAHVEAPTAGSVILAGVLLKMGTYGFVRFGIPLFPEAAVAAVPWIMLLAIIGIWYGAWVAFAQEDVKSLVAYSSISHLGIVMVGLFALNGPGLSGGVLQMVNHGLSTGALFLLVGMIYDRARTREIAAFGGLWQSTPRLAAVFLVVTLSSIGLPGLNGFVGEFLALAGAFELSPAYGALAAFGVVLSAVYMLWVYQRLFFGPPSDLSAAMTDLTGREMLVVLPLVGLMLWIGVYPEPFLGPIAEASQAWIELLQAVTTVAAAP
jgi:NADH-quinone oxidoreductase subunit M